MSLEVQTTSPIQPTPGNSTTQKSSFVILDELINSGKPIKYKGRSFKDDRVVAEFVKDHNGPWRTAMIGTNVFMYVDPCHCCIPGHGPRDFQPGIADATGLINYVREAKERGEPLDIVFTSLNLYNQVKGPLEKISPETKLIVGCGRGSTTTACELRKREIPAIDDNDYNNCAPLNAVIALTVFDELMAG